jgi:hypothetical protein
MDPETEFCKGVETNLVRKYSTCAALPSAQRRCDAYTSCGACQEREDCQWYLATEASEGLFSSTAAQPAHCARPSLFSSVAGKTVCSLNANYRPYQATLAKVYFLAEAIFSRTVFEQGDEAMKKAQQEAAAASAKLTAPLGSEDAYDPLLQADDNQVDEEATKLKTLLNEEVDGLVSAKKKGFAALKKLSSWVATKSSHFALSMSGTEFLSRCPNTENDVAKEGDSMKMDLKMLYLYVDGLKKKHPGTGSARLVSMYGEFDKLFASAEAKFQEISPGYKKLSSVTADANMGDEILSNLYRSVCPPKDMDVPKKPKKK